MRRLYLNRYSKEGNFMMLTVNNELPDWEKFGRAQMLLLSYKE